MAPPCLVFLHLPKTGGSTLSTVLRWQYRHVPPEGILRLSERGADEVDALPAERRARLRLVMGHFPFGIDGHLPMPVQYLTMVRDPVRRVISTYRYVQARPEHPLHEALTSPSMSLADYVTSDVHRSQVENALTRQLAGRDEDDDDDVTEHDLEVATENLHRCFVVGLTERFDETLILLKRRLGWRTPFYFSRNVSDPTSAREEINADTIQLVRDRNALDLRLRDVASEIFDAELRAEDGGFDREVSRFQRWNRVPRTMGGLLEPIAPFVRRTLERRAGRTRS
jgi:Galactose-3-O-sulfotransferase